jgi:hypothetical protein
VRTAEGDVVKVGWSLDGLDLAADVVLLDLVAQVGDSGMCRVVSAKDVDGLLDLVRLVDVVDCSRVSSSCQITKTLRLTGDDGERLVVARIPEGDTGAGHDGEALDVFL